MVIDVLDLNFDVINYEKQYETARLKRAKEIFRNDDVQVTNVEQNNESYEVEAKVKGSYHSYYNVKLYLNKNNVKKYSCTCDDYLKGNICKHILATSFEIIDPHQASTKQRREEIAKKQREEEEEIERIRRQQLEEQRRIREYEKRYSSALDIIRRLKRKSEYINNNQTLNTRNDIKELYDKTLYEKVKKERGTFTTLTTELKIEPRIELIDAQEIDITFKIGNTQMYILKDIQELNEAYLNGDTLEYGKNLKFIAKKESFEKGSHALLDYILDYAQMLNYNAQIYNDYYYGSIFRAGKTLKVIDNKMDDFFEIVKNREIIVSAYGIDKEKFLVTDEEINVVVNVNENNKHNENEYNLSLNIKGYRYLATNKYIYIIYKNKIYRVDKSKNENLENMLNLFYGKGNVLIPNDKIEDFSKYVIPEISDYLNTNQLLDNPAINGLIVNKLASKVYLDLDEKDNIILELKFCYMDYEFNILDSGYKKYVEEKNIVRDVPKEREVLKRIFEDGFELSSNKKYFTLKNQDEIYEFLSEKIASYMNNFEVLVTDIHNFKIATMNKNSNLALNY